MIRDLLICFIGGIICPMLLELWKERRKRVAAALPSAPPAPVLPLSPQVPPIAPVPESVPLREAAPSPLSPTVYYACVAKRATSCAAGGFILAGMTSGFLEIRKQPNIEFGSDIFVIVIALFSIILWFFSNNRDPLRPKAS
jgi:hypothetical protein